MRKELLLAVGTTLATLALALAAIRHFAPQLFGVPVDLQLVGIDESRPPFFELLFRQEKIGSAELLLPDPYTVNRGVALTLDSGESGAHDLAGFRNPSIPAVADVVVLGDSQTYGAGVTRDESWPQQLARTLGGDGGRVYSMALGGWAMPQYRYLLDHALQFRPRMVLIAVYAGNDPLETYAQVYGAQRLAHYRLPDGQQPEPPPPVNFPAPVEDQWRLDLPGDRWLHFTAKGRRINVMHHPASDEGWRLVHQMAAEMLEIGRSRSVDVRFVIIPTRELAYESLLQELGVNFDPEYAGLVQEERARLQAFAAHLERISPGRVVDTTAALQEAISTGAFAYPNGVDGHPAAAGQAAIAAAVADAVRGDLPSPPCGEFAVLLGETWLRGQADMDDRYWLDSGHPLTGPGELARFQQRDLARMRRQSGAQTVASDACPPRA